MNSWTKEEQRVALLNSLNRALSSLTTQYQDYLPEPVLERAFERSKIHSESILRFIPNVSDDVQSLSQGLVLGGLYSGFLCGFLKAHLKGGFELPPLAGDPEEADTRLDKLEDLFVHAYQCKEDALLYATHSSSMVFSNLKKLPSPLIEGMSEEDVDLIEFMFKCSLYAGFMDGFENAIIEGNVPLDVSKIEFKDFAFLNEM